jgi:hypothetical protein
MAIPAVGIDGVRQTVNAGISPTQTLWNLRSGLNVAALNCLKPQHSMLVDNYKILLKRHSRELSRANRDLAGEYRAQHGSNYRKVQDSYMTRVYNYFALPPTLPQFCDAALEVSHDVAQVTPGALKEFAASGLPRIEAVFEDFYKSYEQYRVDLAAWDARYGAGSLPSYGQPVSRNLDAQYAVPGGESAIEQTGAPPSNVVGAPEPQDDQGSGG